VRHCGKRFGCEDARVVDDMIDRAELADRSLCDIVGSGCLTNVPSTSARCGDGAKLALEIAREVATTL
jgi:hypothetical protein